MHEHQASAVMLYVSDRCCQYRLHTPSVRLKFPKHWYTIQLAKSALMANGLHFPAQHGITVCGTSCDKGMREKQQAPIYPTLVSSPLLPSRIFKTRSLLVHTWSSSALFTSHQPPDVLSRLQVRCLRGGNTVPFPWLSAHAARDDQTTAFIGCWVCQHVLARQLCHLGLFSDNFFAQTSRVEVKIVHSAWESTCR